jgi:hypothetical protein
MTGIGFSYQIWNCWFNHVSGTLLCGAPPGTPFAVDLMGGGPLVECCWTGVSRI